MSPRPPGTVPRSSRAGWHRGSAVALLWLVGCATLAGLDEDYVVGGATAAGSGAGGGATSTGAGTGTPTGSGGAGAAGGAAGGDSPTGGAGGEGPTYYATCNALKTAEPATLDGTYEVDVDGAAGPTAPFLVLCDMTTDDGGWTLVGQEHAGEAEQLAFLGVEQGDPTSLAQGGSGLIGVRFTGLYDELRVTWNDGAAHITITPAEEIFANSVATSIGITDFATDDAELAGWVAAAGGAHFCRAAVSTSVRPGDSSWAIKPLDDVQEGCGCNGGGWAGRGAYYSGLSACTLCNCWPGSFVGVKDDGERKADLTNYTTRLFIR